MINIFKIKGKFTLKKNLGHHLKSEQKLGHFGSDPSLLTIISLFLTTKKLGFQIDPLPSLL